MLVADLSACIAMNKRGSPSQQPASLSSPGESHGRNIILERPVNPTDESLFAGCYCCRAERSQPCVFAESGARAVVVLTQQRLQFN